MSRPSFPQAADKHALEDGLALTPKFDAGPIAAVATDADTGEVLMLAWMDAEALSRTIETGEAHFWSRSRKRIWKKGEESGNTLEVVELRTDCDQDAVWMKVRMRGQKAACHTGHRTCFYRTIPLARSAGPGGSELATGERTMHHAGTPRVFDPAQVYRTDKA